MECVLLRYATKEHGYLYLDWKSNKVYINKHVTFHEIVFPSSLSQSDLSQSTIVDTTILALTRISLLSSP